MRIKYFKDTTEMHTFLFTEMKDEWAEGGTSVTRWMLRGDEKDLMAAKAKPFSLHLNEIFMFENILEGKDSTEVLIETARVLWDHLVDNGFSTGSFP